MLLGLSHLLHLDYWTSNHQKYLQIQKKRLQIYFVRRNTEQISQKNTNLCEKIPNISPSYWAENCLLWNEAKDKHPTLISLKKILTKSLKITPESYNLLSYFPPEFGKVLQLFPIQACFTHFWTAQIRETTLIVFIDWAWTTSTVTKKNFAHQKTQPISVALCLKFQEYWVLGGGQCFDPYVTKLCCWKCNTGRK